MSSLRMQMPQLHENLDWLETHGERVTNYNTDYKPSKTTNSFIA